MESLSQEREQVVQVSLFTLDRADAKYPGHPADPLFSSNSRELCVLILTTPPRQESHLHIFQVDSRSWSPLPPFAPTTA